MADPINISSGDRPGPPDSETSMQPRWGRRLLTILIASAAVGGFAMVVVYSYHEGRSDAQSMTAPLIKAQKGPTKVRPKETGGMQVPNRDKQVYGRLNPKERSDKIERLLPPAEKVLPIPITSLARNSNKTLIPSQTAGISDRKLEKSKELHTSAPPPGLTPPDKIKKNYQNITSSKTLIRNSRQKKKVRPSQMPTKLKSGNTMNNLKSVGYRVQLASLRSQKAAKKAWGRLTKSHSGLFRGLQSNIIRVEIRNRGAYYRLQAGPIKNAAAAKSLCSRVKKRKLGCIIVRP